ncbi:MAG: CheR family methyltransferase [Nitrospirota bacterium]
MDMGTNNNTLSKDTFILLRDIIYNKCGIFFAEDKSYILQNRLKNRLKENNCRTFEEYYKFLKFDPLSVKEISSLINVITNNETSFFRDINQLKAFEEMVVPSIIEEKKDSLRRKMRVWSAPCSTGEEPYTIAMILLEKFAQLKFWDIEILASDISEGALASARRGAYKEYSLRNTEEVYKKKYFDFYNGQYMIKPVIKRLVKFTHINLYNQIQVRNIRDMDVIFCRNMIIYFDLEAKKKVIATLYNSLKPDGYLIIGHSESLHGISRSFKLMLSNNSIVYKKL